MDGVLASLVTALRTCKLPADIFEGQLKELSRSHRKPHIPWHQHHHIVFLIHAIPSNINIIPRVHWILKKRIGRISVLPQMDVTKLKTVVKILTGKWVTQWRTSEPLTTSLSITSSLITRASHFFLYSVSSCRKRKDMKTQEIQNKVAESFSRFLDLWPKDLILKLTEPKSDKMWKTWLCLL